MSATKTNRKNKKPTSPSDFKKLKLLITVVNRAKTEFYLDFISGYEVNFQMTVLGKGTAASETLHLLGLEDSEKSVILSVVREDIAEDILRGLDEKFHKLRGGKGIAFTTPLSSVVGVAIYRFLSNQKANNPTAKEEK